MLKLNDNLINLAWEVVDLKGNEKHIILNDGEDWQGDLWLSWDSKEFDALLDTRRYLHTIPGTYYEPPEHIWDEDQLEFCSPKIARVAQWVKEQGFDLEEEIR